MVFIVLVDIQEKISAKSFRSLILSGKKESFDSVDFRFKYHDYTDSKK